MVREGWGVQAPKNTLNTEYYLWSPLHNHSRCGEVQYIMILHVWSQVHNGCKSREGTYIRILEVWGPLHNDLCVWALN